MAGMLVARARDSELSTCRDTAGMVATGGSSNALALEALAGRGELGDGSESETLLEDVESVAFELVVIVVSDEGS